MHRFEAELFATCSSKDSVLSRERTQGWTLGQDTDKLDHEEMVSYKLLIDPEV